MDTISTLEIYRLRVVTRSNVYCINILVNNKIFSSMCHFAVCKLQNGKKLRVISVSFKLQSFVYRVNVQNEKKTDFNLVLPR